MKNLNVATHCLAVAFAAALVGGCDSDSDSDATVEPRDNVVAFATYNTGLAPGYVNYAAERRPAIEALMSQVSADVFCLNEVWVEADAQAVITAASSTFPYEHHVQLEDTSTTPPSCMTSETDPLIACVEVECAGVPDGELSDCVLGKCSDLFFAVAPSCQACMAANLGKSISEIETICLAEGTLWVYEGSSGLILLSKLPLSNTSHTKLDSTLTQRAILGATVTVEGLGDVDVFCTHIESDLSNQITYEGPHGSWLGLQEAQTRGALAFIEANNSGAATRVFMGDINSGPEIPPDIVAEAVEGAYTIMTGEAGYTAWPPAAAQPRCTFCADNAILADDRSDVVIDYVMFRGLPGEYVGSGFERIGTETLDIVDANGDSVTTSPSDHYGVRVQLDYRP